jgi:hypothetical protein
MQQQPNSSYMDSPEFKKLINRSGMREKPAVVYPASLVGSLAARAAIVDRLLTAAGGRAQAAAQRP